MDNFSWDDFLNIIKSKLSSVSYDTWFKDTKLAKITNDEVFIEVPMSFHKDFLSKTYYELIDNIIFQLTNKNYNINFVIEDELNDKTNLVSLSKEDMRQMRKRLQLVFQDPYASLNPRMTVKDLIKAPLDVFNIGNESERMEKVFQIMKQVGLTEEQLNRYPHEFSGGQRQRIVIARAIILDPEFVVCDEPVSALDVSVRSQVLNLLNTLQKEKNLTYMFISHDLSVVKYISDRIAVMYLGRVVELAEKDELYSHAAHPYTKALLSAVPIAEVGRKREISVLEGDVPSPINPPKGCYFNTRCPYADERCRKEKPELRDIGCGHMCACHKV